MTMLARGLALLLVMATISACVTSPHNGAATKGAADAVRDTFDGEMRDAATIFNSARDADADVNGALATAQENGKHVMIILGGDWCHDSMALADMFHSPRFAAMLAVRYELVWVHVPRSMEERDATLARRFGLDSIEGTPTVLILDSQGMAINLADAPTWRNAASRKPAAIYRHFARAVPPVGE
ncbi:MAG: thioredoxin family protein [Sphingopyxis sp.]